MDDLNHLSSEFDAPLRTLLEKAHMLGYRVVGFTLAKTEPVLSIAPRDFSHCTSRCEVGPDGHVECKVHCP